MKSSITSRSLKLLSLATQVGTKEISRNIKDKFTKGLDELASGKLKTRIDQARLITEHLSQLKGAAMKAGQLLSLDAQDYFPPEAMELLTKLQSQSDPVAWETMHAVLVDELGEERVRDFKDLSTKASASASIGQVHRATLNGQKVAIKIQYPDVADSIESDLSILKKIAQSLMLISKRKMDLDELFIELAVVLKQEANYELEAQHQLEFQNLLGTQSDYVLPQPILSHSTKKVLTMTWQEGLPIHEWLKTEPSYEDREHIGRLALELYCREFFDWGFVQTDPNYANFLVQPNPLRLVLLDFGATLRYSTEFRNEYSKLLQAMRTLDRQKIIRQYVEFGLIDARESDEVKDLFIDLLMLSMEPFQVDKQPFRFRDDDYAKRSRKAGQAFAQSLKYTPPPRQILFLHRKLGGIFTLLKRLDLEMDLRPYWERMVEAKS